jgi:hypothetical protein
LEGGPPTFRQDCTCPALLMDRRSASAYGAVTHSRPAFQPVPLAKNNNHWPGPRSLATTNGVSLMSFPPGTEMFQFPGFAFVTYEFSHKSFHKATSSQPRPDKAHTPSKRR